MTWEDSQTQLAAILGAVSVTAPSALTIDRVYPEPPSTIANTPSFVLYPPAYRGERAPSLRIDRYRQRIRLFVLDAELDVAAAFTNSFREATLNAFDDNITLNGAVVYATPPEVSEAGSIQYGGKDYTFVDFFLGYEIKTPKSFGA